MTEIMELSCLMSALLAVIHYDLYAAGRELEGKLRKDYPNLKHGVNGWPCVFTALSIIASRKCITHRDKNTRSEWYDILANIGVGNPTLELKTFGITAKYSSGSIAAFSGRFVLHNVQDIDKDRGCFAFTMKTSVFKFMDVKFPHWAHRRFVVSPTKDPITWRSIDPYT